ncbi:hypothetical protein [Paenibacillus piri]|uniref:Uncharacterized protein n=1 Tax=Paenibacillus piri TaxID=2547395 RepID=A0A4R5K9G3_9BACL|nr:hypothetical protein [Paenibacillus piri]TDF89721.1 hypothetical protein E1757_34515 [Paenibacillus piri]
MNESLSNAHETNVFQAEYQLIGYMLKGMINISQIRRYRASSLFWKRVSDFKNNPKIKLVPDGLAGGLLSMSIQFGSALGLSVVTAVSIVATGPDGTPQAMLEGFRTALLIPVAAAALGAAITAIGLRKRNASAALVRAK